MRYFLLLYSAILLCAAAPLQAQQPRKLPMQGFFPRLSPDGRQLLFTSAGMVGLKAYDLRKGRETVLSEAPGAGYEPAFDDQGGVLFLEKGTTQTLKRFDLKRRRQTSLSESGLIPQAAASRLSARSAAAPVAASSTDKVDGIRLRYADGREEVLRPLGQADYIWISLSPAADRVLFKVVGRSAYVMDLRTRALQEVGPCETPQWASDNSLVYVRTQQEDRQVAAADVFLYDLQARKERLLTGATDLVALNPSVAAGRLAFNTPQGELYILDLKDVQP